MRGSRPGHPTGPSWRSRINQSPKDEDNPDIWVMDADGTNWRNLTDNGSADYQPAWSPDGTKIAYVSLRGENIDVWVMNADGTNQRNLTQRLASASSRRGHPTGPASCLSVHRTAATLMCG